MNSVSQLEEQLAYLTELLRAALSEHPDPSRVAQSFLLPRNAHPTSLIDHLGWLSGQRPKSTNKTAILRALLGTLRSRPIWTGDELPEKAGLLFLSHFLGNNQHTGPYDDYYGTLIDAQSPNGPTVVAKINHTWAVPAARSIDNRSQQIAQVVFSRGSGLARGLLHIHELRRAGQQIAEGIPDPLIAEHVRSKSTSSQNLFAMGLAEQVATLVRQIRPRTLILTWEGHPWERLAIHAARRVSPEITCIGYHHSVLFPCQIATGRALGFGFDPDAIIVAGERSASWYRSQKDWCNLPIAVVGSPRGFASSAKEPNKGGSLLVAPEGIMSETVLLFRTALEAKSQGLAAPIALRLHPILDKKQVMNALPMLANLPDGVTWSNNSLAQAMSEARALLYRGSTVAVQALKIGVRPIYLEHDETYSVDPLEPVGNWRLRVQSAAELKFALHDDIGQSDIVRKTLFLNSVHVANDIFSTPDPAALTDLLSEL